VNSGVAVLGLMLHRYRKLYIAFPAYLLLLIAVARLPKERLPEALAGILCLPFALGLLATVFGFINAEADITAPASACSPWLLRMPVRTTTLALWPIAAAALWASGSWILFSSFYLHPRGVDGPIWWPASMFAALALNLQAILWAPVRRGGVRLVVAITMTMAIGTFGLVAMATGWTAERVSEIYLAVAFVSALCALNGVSRARTSPSPRLGRSAESSSATGEVLIRHRGKPFRSPKSAQFWLEWRRQGRLLPIITAFGLLAMSLPLFWSRDMAYFDGNKTIRVNIWMITALSVVPWIPLLFATVIGMGARPSDVRGSDGVYHLYHATRPLSATDLYRAKIRSITVGVLLSAALTMAVMLVWLWLPALYNDNSSVPFARILFGSFHSREWAVLTGITVTLIAWTWRNQVVGAFVDYLPSRKWATSYPYFVAFTGAMLFALFGLEPAYHLGNSTVLPMAILCGILVAVKMSLAMWFSLKLIRARPNFKVELVRAFIYWVIAAAIAATAMGWIVFELPPSAFPGYFQDPVPELIGVLLVPIARPFAARMALEYGRHR